MQVTLCDPMDYSPPGSSVHGIFQARILEWVAISSSRESSWCRDQTCVSCTAGGFFTAEPPGKPREVTKDTNEQPDEESCRVRSGQLPALEPLSPSPRVAGFASLEPHPSPYSWDSLQAFSCRHDRVLTSLAVLSPSVEGGRGVGAENSKPLILAWSFWCPFRSSPRATPSVKMMPLFLLSFRNLQGFYKPCVRDSGGGGYQTSFQ